MAADARSCAYRFDPDEWEREHDGTSEVDEPWGCPHEPYGDGDRCVFHRPADEVRDGELARAVRDGLSAESGARNAFIGATFGRLDLTDAVLDAEVRRPIDLRHAEFADGIRIGGASVRLPVRLDGAEVHGTFDATGATFERAVECTNARFGDLDWGGARFLGDLTLLGARVDGFGDCRKAAFEGRNDFRATDFTGVDFGYASIDRAEFVDAGFGGDAIFSGVTFTGAVSFYETAFDGYTSFVAAEFHEYCSFYAAFRRSADFMDAVFRDVALFVDSEFHGGTSFDDVRFGDEVDFRGTVFRGNGDRIVSFLEATFEGPARFSDVRFEAPACFPNAAFADGAFFERVRADYPGSCIDLTGTTIARGAIVLPRGGGTYYDLTGATVGPVTLDAEGDRRGLFDAFLIVDTAFDGFDFGRYHDVLAPDWTLHGFAGGATANGAKRDIAGGRRDRDVTFSTLPADLRPDRIENTYLKAKNGAEGIGDDAAASEFFIKEMVHRQRRHRAQVRDGTLPTTSRLRALGDWFANRFLQWSCGYGERPRNVILSSGVVVIGFSLWFRAIDVAFQTGGGWPDYVVFSLQSFVTFLVGTRPAAASLIVRLSSVVEGFVGAFFIALFVFALTRSIHR